MRVFVALEIPERFRFEVADLARQLERGVAGRFVPPGNYHITMAFLGDQDEQGVQGAMTAIDVARSRISGGAPLICDGLGKFGKASDATLWLGLGANSVLADVAAKIREALEMAGLDFDRKPFKPHITLARRAKIPTGALPTLAFPEPDRAVAITLFKSELHSEGAIYAPLHSVGLGK